MDTIWELRGSVIPALIDFFATQGMSPLFHSKEEVAAFVARDGSAAARGCGIYFGAALASAASSAAFVRRASRAAPASACHICCTLSFGRQL